MQKGKWLPEEALKIAVKRKEEKNKGEKERYTHLNAEFQRIARRNKEAFLSDECKVLKHKKERSESLPQLSVKRNRGKQLNGKD